MGRWRQQLGRRRHAPLFRRQLALETLHFAKQQVGAASGGSYMERRAKGYSQLAAESVCLRAVRILSGDVMIEDLAAPQCAALILSPCTMGGVPGIERCFPNALDID